MTDVGTAAGTPGVGHMNGTTDDALVTDQAPEVGETAVTLEAPATLDAALAEARAEGVAYLRRALLAEHAGRVVPELVTGETPEALTASIAGATAAWDRATESAKQALRADHVPAGAPARTGDAGAEGLSSLGKIARGLRNQ